MRRAAEAEASAKQRENDEEDRRRRAEAAAAQARSGAGFFEDRARAVKEELRSREARVRGPAWEDPTFAGTAARYGPGGKPGAHDKYQPWTRFRERIPAGTLVSDGFDPDDLIQGSLGDCWLIAALAVVAQRPGLMERIFPVRESPKGVWPVQICFNREWTTMWIDECFPMWQDGLSSRGKPLVGSVYVTSRAKEEMWPCLLEKAYAKFYGSYVNIDGGNSHHAFADLTGGLADSWDLGDLRKATPVSKIWADLKSAVDNRHLVACGSHSGSDTTQNKSGIVQGHAFSILSARDCNDGRGNSLQMVKIRNPHGRSEWTGRYSDTDRARWTSRLKKEMDHDPEASGDDGTFCMIFEDFIDNYANVYVCRILTPYDEATGKGWHVNTVSGAWKKGVSAGGCTNQASSVINPTWTFQPTKPCSALVSIRAVEASGSSRDYQHVGMYVVANGGKRVRNLYSGEVRCRTPFSNSRELMTEAELRPELLTVMPCTFYPDVELAFVLTVATTAPLSAAGLELLSPDAPVR